MALSDMSNKHYGSPKQIWTLDFVKEKIILLSKYLEKWKKNVSHACLPKTCWSCVCIHKAGRFVSSLPCSICFICRFSLPRHAARTYYTGAMASWKARRTMGSCMSRFNRRATKPNNVYWSMHMLDLITRYFY